VVVQVVRRLNCNLLTASPRSRPARALGRAVTSSDVIVKLVWGRSAGGCYNYAMPKKAKKNRPEPRPAAAEKKLSGSW
jgi:hypothetical protein